MPVDRAHEAASFPGFGDALLDASLPTPTGIVGPDGNPAPKRFGVYRNNVISSLIEALEQTFPAVQHMLGEEYFKALARDFVVAHPPTSPVLIWYGDEFPAFVECFKPLAPYPYLSDVARVEWAWLQAYHSQDAAPLDPSELAAVAPKDLGAMVFAVHPAVFIVQSSWPVWSLVAANRFALGEAQVEIDFSDGQSVLVTRPHLDVELMRLRSGGALFLEKLMSGATLGVAAEETSATDHEFVLSDTLTDFLSLGVFRTLL
ncbi:DNA-binding domain-containing protein [Roseibium algae]|uniref:DNA-binding domain-containing protein n=1 Tax=Roseibium algae TaxID=3123038 RepID=A0ABU8TG27_9HYPH